MSDLTQRSPASVDPENTGSSRSRIGSPLAAMEPASADYSLFKEAQTQEASRLERDSFRDEISHLGLGTSIMTPGGVSRKPVLGLAGSSGDKLRSLIIQKERELHEINEYRQKDLENQLQKKDIELSKYRERMAKLKEDFAYNLKLIEDRDEELYRYEETLGHLKAVVQEKEVVVSEMKMKIADAEQAMEKEISKRKEQQHFYTEKLKDLSMSLEQSHSTRGDNERKLRKEFEDAKREWELEISAKEDQLQNLRKELTENFDKVLKEKLVAAGKQRDEERAKLKDVQHALSESKKRLQQAMAREEEMQRRVAELEKSEETLKKSEKKLSWAVEDERRLTNAKLADLENEKAEAVASKKKLLDEYEGKMAELLKALHTVERAFTLQKEGYEKKIQEMEEGRAAETSDLVRDLTAKLAHLTQKLSETETELTGLRSAYKKSSQEMKALVDAKERELRNIKEALRENQVAGSRNAEDRSEVEDNLNTQVQTLSKQLADVTKELENMHARYHKSLEKAGLDHSEQTRELLQGQQRLKVENRRLKEELDEFKKLSRMPHILQTPKQTEKKDVLPALDLEVARVSPIQLETPNYNFIEDLEQKEAELSALKKENDTLASALRKMRQELESLETPKHTVNAEFLEERAGLLKQVEKLRHYIKVLQGAVDFDDAADYYKTEVTMLRDLCDTLTEQLNAARQRLCTVASIGQDPSAAAVDNVGQTEDYRGQLEQTKADLAKMLKERDKLIELTNQLKARSEREEDNARFEKIVKITEKQVSKAYQKKIDAVEEALETLVLQNRDLKQKLKEQSTKSSSTRPRPDRMRPPVGRTRLTPKSSSEEGDSTIAAKVQTLRERLAAKDIIPSSAPREGKPKPAPRRAVKPRERKKVRNYNVAVD